MADPQFPPAAPALPEGTSNSPATELQVTTSQADIATINQVILKPSQPIALPAFPVVAPELVDTVERLVKIVEQLRSPASGWSSNLPRTPEAIAPYVMEEVYDVLETLQLPGSDIALADKRSAEIDSFLWHNYFGVKDLAPWLLWAIARSTYEVMRLLEGVNAKVFQPGLGWQTGTLRLATALHWKASEQFWSFDLVTHQPSHALLFANAMVQISDYDLCREPSGVDGLLKGITQQIESATPVISSFLEGFSVDALMPGEVWQSGVIRLDLGFEFMPEIELDEDTEAHQLLLHQIPVNPQLVISFTDKVWLQKYQTVVTRQQLALVLPYLHLQEIKGLEAPEAIAVLIQDACKAADILQTSLTVVNRNITQQDWRLDELSLRLLWCISRSAHEVMQLMGGVRTNILQPGKAWEEGVLRLLVGLELQTSELEWKLDLITGQPCQPNRFAASKDAIVQSGASEWCQTPNLIKHLEDRVLQEIKLATPEVQLLLDGTYVDLADADLPAQPGTVQLFTRFEFVL